LKEQKCDALGCNKKPTQKIKVSVRKLGFIELDVCDGCVGKFQEENK
jgi:hypothetical protein